MTRKHHWFAGTRMTLSEQRLGRYLRAPEGHPDDFANAFDVAAAAAAPGDSVPSQDPPAPAPTPEPTPAPAPATPEPSPAPAPAAPPEAPAAPAPGGDAGVPPAPAAPGAEGTPPASAPAPEGTPPVATPPAPAAPEKPAAPDATDVLARLAEVLENKAPAAPAAPVAPAADTPPIYNTEETEFLAQYEKDWPDVNKAETLKRRAEYTDLLSFVFTEMNKQIAPLREGFATVGNSIHLGEVKALVPDYSDNLEADVAKWVDTQPEYLQNAYKQVMQAGTSDEIADLIGRYRAASGTAPAPAAPAAAVPPAPAKPATELSSAAIQAADSLAPVGSERTAVPEGENSQDFDTAFAKYAAEMMPT